MSPVTEMGCAAGISGIIYAKTLQANPGKRCSDRCWESYSNLQLNDSMSNIVSAAILETESLVFYVVMKKTKVPKVLAEEMYHFVW
jgi:predicted naringenin-chalcone synthase